MSHQTTPFPLRGRHVFITGASAGIGAATARRLAADGAHLTLVARREERLRALAAELGHAEVLVGDVRDPHAFDAYSGAVPDVLILNAGLARGTQPLFHNTPDEIDDMIDTNVKGYLHLLRRFLPAMQKRQQGDVVLLGSVAGRQVYPGGGVYCMTKHAVRALYESLRVDAGGHGLRFTTVDPGMVETEFSEVRLGDADKASQVYKGFEALQPEDIADVIHYALTRPPHVNLGELVVWPTAQASTTRVERK